MDCTVKINFIRSEVIVKGLATFKEDENEKIVQFQTIEGELPSFINKHLMTNSVDINDGSEVYKDKLIYFCKDKDNSGHYLFTIHKKNQENKYELQPQGKSTQS